MKIKSKVITATIIGLSIVTVGQMTYASTKEPGSDSDPLVTLSYVDLKMEQLRNYIDQKTSESNNNQGGTTQVSATFQVVELKRGRTLIAGGGTELILRSGEATAIVSDLGGLSDVTGAKDLGQNEKIPANHLLIIPRNDGRGILATADSFLMIKGDYTIR